MNKQVKKLNDQAFAPCVIELNQNSPQAVDFLSENIEVLQHLVYESGGVLIRGGGIDSPEQVQKVSDIFFKDAIKTNTEHRPVAEGSSVQRPVEYSNSEFLLWHNENTFNHTFPAKAIFACEVPAAKGGQTPVVDCRSVYDDLDPAIRQEFVDKQVMYVRKYEDHDFVGLGWKTIFATSDKAIVEQKCHDAKLEFEWINSNTLITRAIRPAVMNHPVTGDVCWINQIMHWHFHCLSEQAQADIKILFPEEKLYPRNAYFGDGSKIPNEYIDHIHEIHRKHHMEFDWQKGDLLLVDNILKAHSRNAYEGERKVLVCFGDPISFS